MLRDQIKRLREAQARQVAGGGSGDLDVVAVRSDGNQHCVGLMFVRSGDVLGSGDLRGAASGSSRPNVPRDR